MGAFLSSAALVLLSVGTPQPLEPRPNALVSIRPDSLMLQEPAGQALTAGRTFVQGGLGVLGGVPTGGFGDHVDSAGGLTVHLGAGLGDTIVSLGGEVSFLWYGEETRRVPFSLTIPDVLVTVTTSNNLFLGHARLRAQPRAGRWRPYADGLLGVSHIYTRTHVDLGSETLTDAVSSTNLGDTGLSYGAGGGVTVGFGSPPGRTRLDLSLRYIAGPEADYLTEGGIRREGGEVILDVRRSRTDMIGVYVGVSWASY